MTATTNANAPGQGRVGGTSESSVPQFCYPDPSAVKGRVLGALLRGEKLSHLDCWRRFGSARLSHHVYMLRRMGWPVLMNEHTVSTSDAGRQATIGIYSLPQEAIDDAGARGLDYAAECLLVEIERRAA
ncbi:MAG: hypothetical protein HZC22_19665 [Rhodocyclales bacterium]|nr:hypothetical protein [Rhodocyclales bacterium]